ncbi:translation initiation factor eIF3 subunit 135-domain-containing protein, partial [Gorgonomyces haynaldii]
MLSQDAKPIKQGWVLKKAGSGFLAQWKTKYLVLCPYRDSDLQLLVFDQRDTSKPPKHRIILSEARIDAHGQMGAFKLLAKGATPFTISGNGRKFYFATHTKIELDDWMQYFEIKRRPRQATQSENWDTRSVYSVATEYQHDDDCVSVVSGMTRMTTNTRYEDDVKSAVSNVDTLSFYADPILTPYELSLMGDTQKDKELKRRTPVVKPHYNQWNEKYQQLLSAKCITEEASLQKDIQLVEFIGDFQEVASFHAKNMIDEYHIGLSNSYPLKDLQCHKDGMTLRFACNYDEMKPADVDTNHCRASDELRAVNAVTQAIAETLDQSKSLHTLLMALVDYKGFRVICYADIGNATNMQVIHDLNPRRLKIDEKACELTNAIGQFYNLQSHTVQVNQDRRVRVYLAANAEIHMDRHSNQLYLTSLRDMFPIDHYTNEDHLGQVNPEHRLRPEFLRVYQGNVCADGLLPASGASRAEKEENDAQVIKAGRFLRETWIPSFIQSLDAMEVRPFDSYSLTLEMHKRGVNVRYLGLICHKSSIPFIRNICLIEMVARTAKHVFRTRLREAILHFKSVGATNIDAEMRGYGASFFSSVLGVGDKTKHMFESRLRPLLVKKFGYPINWRQFTGINKHALFHAMQYHCGVIFDDSMDYDFDVSIPVERFLGFQHRVKTLQGTPRDVSRTGLKEEERLAYMLQRHFKMLGSKSKLVPSNLSAQYLTTVAAYFNSTNRYEEARLYAQAACSIANKNHIVSSLASAQHLDALAGLQSTTMGGPDPTILSIYRQALLVGQWHWGQDSLMSMCLHDKMSLIYHKAKDTKQALEHHKMSLEIAEKSLGKTHFITAGYLTRAGCYLSNLGFIEEAILHLTQAAEVFTSLQASPSLIAEVHYYFADCLSARGDIDGAIHHAQKCRKIRERIYGLSDPRVMDSCRQTAKMILAPFQDYKGVLTPPMKQAYREAIQCHEKVFRYLQSKKKGKLNKRGTIRKAPVQEKELLLTCGPLVQSPFGWAPPLSASLLHKLTKEIVSMKLNLADAPRIREIIRMFRVKGPEIFDAEEAKQTILRMAAVSPSVYLDDIFHRINHNDTSAVNELAMVMTLTERETVGIAQ